MLFILSEKSHFPRITERLIDILRGQPCCRGCHIQFMGQIDTADSGVIRVDAGEQPLGEKLAEWVAGEIWHGAGLDMLVKFASKPMRRSPEIPPIHHIAPRRRNPQRPRS